MNAQERTKGTKEQAIKSFQRHQLIRDDRETGRWLIARKYDDGSLDGTYAAEVISLWGGRLFVGGDIDDCTFAYYSGGQKQGSPEWHLAKLRWMGCCDDLGYYVAQKAVIGIGDRPLVQGWAAEVAEDELREYLAEPDWSEQNRAALQEALSDIAHGATQDEVYQTLHDNMSDGGIDVIGSLGIVTSPRVVYAWAAMRRLCELIDEKDGAANGH